MSAPKFDRWMSDWPYMGKKNRCDSTKQPGAGTGSVDVSFLFADDAAPKIPAYTSDEMRAMSLTELVSHTVRLQQSYRQLDNDYRILSWEHKEYADNITLFSRAAKLAHKLNASDLETIGLVAVYELPTYFNCRFAALYFYNPAKRLLELCRSTSPTPDPAPLSCRADSRHFLATLFLSQSRPFVASYASRGKILAGDGDEEIVAEVPDAWHALLGDCALVIPLQVQQAGKRKPQLLGVLVLGDSQRPLEPRDAEMSIMFSDLLSSSLFNARLVQQLNEMAIIDPLTQIYNRRHFIGQLGTFMLHSNRYHHPLSIIMLDIDFFKRINDTYGHVCGDWVLHGMGELLKRTVRTGLDIPARYGGEEFIVIMPSATLDNAVVAAERIRDAVKKHDFTYGDMRLSITCSLGAAEYIREETIEKFIDRADAALYAAKNSGRDKVSVASSFADGT